MLNGLEKTLEKKLPISERRWHVTEAVTTFGHDADTCPVGWPTPDPCPPKPET